MLKRLSGFARQNEEADLAAVQATKILFNIQLTVIRLNPSSGINENSIVSGCFLCGGKISKSQDKSLTRIANGDWEAEYGEKLSLVVDMLGSSSGKYQDKYAKVIIRQRKKNYSDENNLYDGVGIVLIPLHDIAVVSEPHTIDAHTFQERDRSKSVVVNMTVTSKIISQHAVGTDTPDDSVMSSSSSQPDSDWSDDDLTMSLAADFTQLSLPASPEPSASPSPVQILRSISDCSLLSDFTGASTGDADLEASTQRKREKKSGVHLTKEEYEELMSSHAALKQQTHSQEMRIQQLQSEMVELIDTLRLDTEAVVVDSSISEIGDGEQGKTSPGVSAVEFENLKKELVVAKKELWKERLRTDAISSANKRADEATGIALAHEKQRADELEEEYVAASAKLEELEVTNRAMRAEIAANSAIFSCPGKEHLLRHLHEMNSTAPSEQSDGVSTSQTEEIARRSESGGDVDEAGMSQEALVQELVASKVLLARVASELQEERNIVTALSMHNQKYAMRLAELEVDAVSTAEELDEIKHSWTPPSKARRGSIFGKRQSATSEQGGNEDDYI